jgi:hypothetical protein
LRNLPNVTNIFGIVRIVVPIIIIVVIVTAQTTHLVLVVRVRDRLTLLTQFARTYHAATSCIVVVIRSLTYGDGVGVPRHRTRAEGTLLLTP